MNPMRIDVHHHLLTSEYVEALAAVGIVEAGGVPFPAWTPDASLAMLDRAGIQAAILSVSAPGLPFEDAARRRALARSLNVFAAHIVARIPERFGSFATLPLPDVEAALDELVYALDTLHADGVVLYSNYAGIYLGDARFDPIFAELDRRAAVVFLHPTVYTGSAPPAARNAGSPIAALPGFMLEFVFDTTRAVANLVLTGTLQRYPRARIILSHAGGTVPFVAHKLVSGGLWMTLAPLLSAAQSGADASPTLPPGQPDQVEAARRAFEADIFAQLRALYYDTALSANRQVLNSLQELAPTTHILLGTDYPFAPEIESGTTIRRLDALASLSEQERQAITSHNALTLFPRFQH